MRHVSRFLIRKGSKDSTDAGNTAMDVEQDGTSPDESPPKVAEEISLSIMVSVL